jgi:hypothetical protein
MVLLEMMSGKIHRFSFIKGSQKDKDVQILKPWNYGIDCETISEFKIGFWVLCG